MTWCGCLCDAVEDAADWVEDAVNDCVDAVGDAIDDAIETIGGWIEDAAEWIAETAKSVAEFVADVAGKVWDWITEAASDIWDWIKKVAGDVWEWTRGAIEDAWDWVSEAGSDAWDWIKGAAETVWDAIVIAAKTIADFVEEKVVPFLIDVLWILTHIDELTIAGALGFLCLLTGQDEKEYDVIEGMFMLDEEVLADRRVAFLPIEKNYVIFSDLHLFVSGDPLDKFRQIGNHELYKIVLATYYANGHTLIENGDIEDLWMRETSTFADVVQDATIDVLGYPFGDILQEDREKHRIRSQAIKIFDNNIDVYQTIRNLFYDTGRYVRILGNHDDYWRSSEYLEGLQLVYPGIEVFDYVFLGYYDNDPHSHSDDSPRVIVAHGHQLDAWNNHVCRGAGARITESVSGISSLAASIVERSEWRENLNGAGFGNKLANDIGGINEEKFYENIMDDFRNQPYVPQFILGHTHRALKDPLLSDWNHIPALKWTGEGRFSQYTNDGTAGRWEQFIWCVSVANQTVSLHGWTWGSDGGPVVYTFEGINSDYLQVI